MSRIKRTQKFYKKINEECFFKIKKFVDNYENTNNTDDKCHILLSNYKNLTIDILKTDDIKWNLIQLALNDSLTDEMVDYILTDTFWDKHKSLTKSSIMHNWTEDIVEIIFWKYLSRNTNISTKCKLKNSEYYKYLDKESVSEYLEDYNLVKEYLYFDWDFASLARN